MTAARAAKLMAVLGFAWEDPVPAVGERRVGAVSSSASLVDSYFWKSFKIAPIEREWASFALGQKSL